MTDTESRHRPHSPVAPSAASPPPAPNPPPPSGSRLGALWRELSTFGVIGVLNFVIDIGLFNLLVAGPMAGRFTLAKVVSGCVATIFAWVGNRYWTFRGRQNRPLHHEVLLFFVVNGIALAATTAWVAFAHHSLGARSALWVNVNVLIGIAIGTVLRFIAYRTVVFGEAAENPTA